MTKFTDANDPGYQRVSGELWIWYRDINKSRTQAEAGTSQFQASSLSSSAPMLLPETGESSSTAKHYYMGSMHNVGQVFQGSNNATIQFGSH